LSSCRSDKPIKRELGKCGNATSKRRTRTVTREAGANANAVMLAPHRYGAFMVNTPAKQAAQQLWQHWQAGTTLDTLPQACRPLTREQGYAAQACLPEASGRSVLGWKIAATSTAGQSHINVSGPLAGRILSGQTLTPGAKVPPAGNRMKVAESEMAFVFARDMAARPQKPYAVDEVMQAVASLHPSIEIPNSRFAQFTAAGEAQLLADNACAHQFILGPRAPEGWQQLDLSIHPVAARVTHRDGRHWERTGSGAAVLGDPRVALTWLVNELSALGIGLHAGQFVTTGTCMVPLELTEGDRVDVDFGVLGRIGMQFTD
jgi:2-keto-4-pentenoate hydratase